MDNSTEEWMTCDECGAKATMYSHIVSFEGRGNLCEICGAKKPPEELAIEPLEQRYSVLRMLGGTCKVLAVLVGLAAVFIASVGRGSESFFAVIGGVVGVISLWAMAEMQSVFMDTEENTRETVRQLRILNGK